MSYWACCEYTSYELLKLSSAKLISLVVHDLTLYKLFKRAPDSFPTFMQDAQAVLRDRGDSIVNIVEIKDLTEERDVSKGTEPRRSFRQYQQLELFKATEEKSAEKEPD